MIFEHMVKSSGPLPSEASHATEYFELLKLCVDVRILEPTELSARKTLTNICEHTIEPSAKISNLMKDKMKFLINRWRVCLLKYYYS